MGKVEIMKFLLIFLAVCLHQAMGFYWGGWGWGGFPLNNWRIYGGRWGLGAGHGGFSPWGGYSYGGYGGPSGPGYGGYSNGYGIWGFDGDMNTHRQIPYRPIPINHGFGVPIVAIDQRNAGQGQAANIVPAPPTSGTQATDTSNTQTTDTSNIQTTDTSNTQATDTSNTQTTETSNTQNIEA